MRVSEPLAKSALVHRASAPDQNQTDSSPQEPEDLVILEGPSPPPESEPKTAEKKKNFDFGILINWLRCDE